MTESRERSEQTQFEVLSAHLRAQADRLCTAGIVKKEELAELMKRINGGGVETLLAVQEQLRKLDPNEPRRAIHDWKGRFFLDDPDHPQSFEPKHLHEEGEKPARRPGTNDDEEMRIGRWH